ncbi:hypothetical protein IQ37_14905 [Chryseobacterium piperi]|uniref:DUF4932 domain-containing protein n=1 Tax=Chryseobacterium piperi TaxID=558152 RepID=A0A086B136_9FLAO|nr:DUF4932 domain-containing protein [Chryseobacterium piperi]ASW73685.1 DUF4932 domain-containing protein [Chryseobacterium piperi]KFF22650.1 hypothetical protein IQ37_14905 [Chryseobacterium piperi]
MKKILTFFLILFSTLSFSQKKPSKFIVSYNKNVETYFLAEILSADHRKVNKDFEAFKIKECSTYQPIVKRALEKYGNLNNSKIAKLTATINDTLIQKYGIGNDALMSPLLYHKEFPSSSWNEEYQFNSNSLTKEQNEEVTSLIKNYIVELHQFYVQENIADFFKENQAFYKGGIAEYNNQIPVGFTSAMEKFYGESFDQYVILISPMMMWPIDGNEGRGIGVDVKQKSGNKSIYEIASPFVKVKEKGQFGYDNQFQARFLTVHEFGHSFINKEVYKYKDKLEGFKDLFEKSNLKEVMIKTGGYGDFQTCVAEHLVRLGEIQTAIIQNDFERAEMLEAYHRKNNFIFLPRLEQKLKEYLANRTQYKTFGDFIPKLLEIFDDTSIEWINDELNKNKIAL